jgi:glycosyltransferase involved in cell wall biosynthesis
MLISIGILAWNEAASIEATVKSLLGQSALRGPAGDLPGTEWEIVVVPNGCTDDTAARARQALAEGVAATGRRDLRWAVHEVPEAGKSNAWNRYVHEFASPTSELIVMLDADIVFGEAETISNTVRALLADPAAVAAVDMPLKDVVRKPRKTLLERISVAASRAATSGQVAISGQFFCARAAALRDIWMPRGLSVEDGFLRAMIVTDCFRSPPDEKKVIRAPNASHYYETLTSLRDIFRHELRLVVGTALNCYLLWDFLAYATDPRGAGAGALIRSRMTDDDGWYPNLMANAVRNHGWWALPRGTLFRRFAGLRARRGLALLRSLPIATVGTALDIPVFLLANQKLKRRSAIGYW